MTSIKKPVSFEPAGGQKPAGEGVYRLKGDEENCMQNMSKRPVFIISCECLGTKGNRMGSQSWEI